MTPCSKPSALKWAYLLIFTYTLVSVVHDTWVSFNLASEKQQMTTPAQSFNMGCLLGVLALFSFAITLHIVRLYLSLEMMEGCEKYRNEVLGDVSVKQSPFEFILRIVVILLISLKVHWEMKGIFSLSLALLLIYAVLLVWDMYVLWCRRCKVQQTRQTNVNSNSPDSVNKRMSITEWTFLGASVIGMSGSLALVLLSWRFPDSAILLETVVLALMGGGISISVIVDLVTKKNPRYQDFFWHDFTSAFTWKRIGSMVNTGAATNDESDQCCITRVRDRPCEEANQPAE